MEDFLELGVVSTDTLGTDDPLVDFDNVAPGPIA